MIQYARKYKSKHKMANRTWSTYVIGWRGKDDITRLNTMVFKVYDVKLEGSDKVYTNFSKEFAKEFQKVKMWHKLSQPLDDIIIYDVVRRR